ncbi:MAG: bifunctional phosphoribosylaminoimidazolecarboxamide formyltransferase/IMP cyclohydrolase [Rickettsiales bacterium]|nr:bifunctional phosphoribosylaminoimidazolecarboxamide formyltransferase/IMP cyclohydrolase [Rickettsiales bacterium]
MVKRRALISVSDKTGLVEFVQELVAFDIDIISTGGTAKVLKEAGIAVQDISDYTGFPEMMDGRVKTLHPKVHGGLLAVRDNQDHLDAMKAHAIDTIDFVIVNLYPFRETVAKGASYEECIENIDIGGPSMVRSAAKNHQSVNIIVDPADYAVVIEALKQHDGETTLELRQQLAARAYALTASYDAAISSWFAKQQGELFPKTITIGAELQTELRYGENPDQKAAVYHFSDASLSIPNAKQLQGKELSYNNINDADAALQMVRDFDRPTVAIIKHANPCGIASDDTIEHAYDKALACDPVSAFGGIFAFNRPITKGIADRLAKMFVEVVIAPAIDADAREQLASKKNMRLLITESDIKPNRDNSLMVSSIAGGLLFQQNHILDITADDIECVTKRKPTDQELKDLLFAYKTCKHVKSNAIVFAKNEGTVGIGAGQMSRLDSVRIAALKAADGEGNEQRASGAVVASDAFFPFADGLLTAIDAGIVAAIQPGGSIRDDEVIKAADDHNIAMVLTKGKRCFKH